MRRRTVLSIAGTLAASLALAAASASAAPTWLEPESLGDGTISDVALSPTGTAAAAWQRVFEDEGQFTRAQVALRPPGGPWGAPETLSRPGRDAFEPRMGVDSAGNAVAVWLLNDGVLSDGGSEHVQGAVRPAGGAWSRPVSLSPENRDADDLRMAVGPTGLAVAVWFDRGIWAAVRPPGGSWEPARHLSGPEGGRDAAVAVDAEGDALVVWDHIVFFEEEPGSRVYAVSRPAGSDWGVAQPISPDDGRFVADPAVALAPDGRAVAAWESHELGGDGRIHAARRTADGSWSAAEPVSEPGHNVFGPEVALSATGRAAATWTRRLDTFLFEIRASERQPAGSWSAPRPVSSATTETAAGTAIGADRFGGALATWPVQNGAEFTSQFGELPPEGPWRPGGPVPKAGGFSAALAVAPDGDALLGGTVLTEPFGSSVAVVVRDAAGPRVDLRVPATATAGKRVEMAASVLDDWSPLSGEAAWDLGDGTVGTGPSVEHVYLEPGRYTVRVRQSDAVGNRGEALARIDVAAGEPRRQDPPGHPPGKPRPPHAHEPGPNDGPSCRPRPDSRKTDDHRPGPIRLDAGQLRANQRIGQAAIRRLNAVAAWLGAGIRARDLCGGAIGPAKLAPGIGASLDPGIAGAAAPPDPRPIRVPSAGEQFGRVALSAAQLRINQRIYQAAVRRANALERRLDGNLTGGDLAAGAVSPAALVPGLRIMSVDAFSAEPRPGRAAIAQRRSNAAGPVRLTVAQLTINQRIAQAAVRRANDLIARLGAGLTGDAFADGSITAADLAPEVIGW